MKIDFILSDTTKTATTQTLREVTKRAEREKLSDFVVIVPETKSIIIEEEILALSKNHAAINIFVYSFVRLLTKLMGSRPTNVLDRQSAILVIRKIISDNIKNLDCYKKSAKTIGFAEKIYETITQLKSSGLCSLDLKAAMESVSPSLKHKLADIALLTEKYEQYLGSGLLDECDRLMLLKKYAGSSELLKNSEVFVVGFDNITFEMEEVLAEIAKNARSVTFSAVYFNENRADKHIQKNELFGKFKHIADELKQPYVPKFFKTFENGDFYEISNNLFSAKKQSAKSDGAVCVYIAKTKNDEIEFVANTILNEVASGKRFCDIAIFACDLNKNAELIERVMNKYEIPVFINRKHDISNHFLVNFVISSFKVVMTHLSQSDVLEFLSNPLFDCENLSATLNYVNQNGTNYGEFLQEIECEDFDKEKFEQVKNNFARLKEFYNEFEKKIGSCKVVDNYLRVTDFLFEKFSVKEKLYIFSETMKKSGSTVSGEITKVVFDYAQRVSEMLSNFMGNAEVDTAEFLQLYRAGFSQMKVNLAPLSIDCVCVGDSTDGFFDIKDMFIFDAVDGKFPLKVEDKGIILDSELAETKAATNKAIEPNTKQINSRENFRAFEALLEPKEKLFLSYTTSGGGDNVSEPSVIISRLVRLFGEQIVKKDYKKFEFKSKLACRLEFSKMVSDFYGNDPLAPTLDEISKRFFMLKNSFGEKFLNHIQNLSYSLKDFTLQGAKELYSDLKSTSATRLEEYFGCPYRYFACYGLNLKENKVAKMGGMNIGTVIHEVIEKFSQFDVDFEKLDEKEFKKYINSLLDFALEDNHIKISKNISLVKFLREECVRICKNIISEQQNSNFKIGSIEQKFDSSNAVCFDACNKSIKLNGKPDRIDFFKDFIRIVDYKTGDISSSLKSMYYGEKIQLVIYLLATKNLSKQVAALVYLPVHSDFAEKSVNYNSLYKMQGFLLDDADVVKNMDLTLCDTKLCSDFVPLKISLGKDYEKTGKISINHQVGNFLSQQEFESIENYIKKLCETALDEILSGYIEPSPLTMSKSDDEGKCSICKFRGYCGLERSKFEKGRLCSGEVSEQSFFVSEGDDNGR